MQFKSVTDGDLTPIFSGDRFNTYRDPACYYHEGKFYLFMTYGEKDESYMYNMVAMSVSEDLVNWSEPKILTQRNRNLNFCSPGNIIKVGDEYILTVTSYPLPDPYRVRFYATDEARIFTMKTKDFKEFSEPEIIMAKGDMKIEDMGRMIDPYIIKSKDEEKYFLMFKQNGVSLSHSYDLKNWEFDGSYEGGENACVIIKDGEYYLIHSPDDGIGIKKSKNLRTWEDLGVTKLGKDRWNWASGRLTAGFMMEAPKGFHHKYILFFHGSKKEIEPETHGGASIGIAFTDDLKNYYVMEN